MPASLIKNPPTRRAKNKTILALCLFALAFCAIFWRLDSPSFWDDEAHVALFARQFLATHNTLAWDGRNLIPDRNCSGYNASLHYSLPQLDNYVAAGSFAIFGESTWAGRLPFALCGFAALGLFWLLLKHEFPKQAAVQLYGFAASLSVSLFLYVRTCRYYALSMLLAVAVFYFYKRFLERHRWTDALMLGLCGGVLSLSSVLNSACILGALAVRHLVFHRREATSRRDWIQFAAATGLFAAIIVPYLLVYILPTMAREKAALALLPVPPPHTLAVLEILTRLNWNLAGLNLVNTFPWMLALLFIFFLRWSYTSPAHEARASLGNARVFLEYIVFLGVYLVLLSFLSPQPPEITKIADVRYLAPVLPLIAIPVGGVFWYIHQRKKWVAPVLLLLYASTNVFSFIPGMVNFQPWGKDFIQELCKPYPTACSEVVKFLRPHAQKDDTVWVFPENMGKPLVFYAGDLVEIRGFLNPDLTLPTPRQAIEKIDKRIFTNGVFPNWVISFGKHDDTPYMVHYFSRIHRENGKETAYHYVPFQALNIYWEEIQRPELPWHHFGPRHVSPKKQEGVYIFKRMPATTKEAPAKPSEPISPDTKETIPSTAP